MLEEIFIEFSLSLQVLCAHPGCKVSFTARGHTLCRQHAGCKIDPASGLVHWDPNTCTVCQEHIRVSNDTSIDKDARLVRLKMLRSWVYGFKKNRPRQPYLPTEQWRRDLFPKAELSAVVTNVSSTTFRPASRGKVVPTTSTPKSQTPAEPSPSPIPTLTLDIGHGAADDDM